MNSALGQLLVGYRETANQLRAQLHQKSLTQAELAKVIGVTSIAVGNWERGLNTPGVEHLKSLIKVYLSEGAFPQGTAEQAVKELWEMAGRSEPFPEEWFRKLPRSRYRPFSGDERQILQRALATNPRKVSLLEAIESVGLVDIENRNDRGLALPPEQFYDMAKHEIVITGVSTYRTFDQDIDLLHRILKAGKRLCILILHPDAEDVKLLSRPEFEDRDIRFEVVYVVSIAKRLSQQYPDFHIRFMEKLPPFTGVMIDGDIEPAGEPLDQEGQIRVQPRAAYKSQHQGMIVQLKKLVGVYTGPFDYFAQDMREQWRHAVRLEKLVEDVVL